MKLEGEIPFELEILSQGVEYQRWLSDTVRPYLGSRILELGAGIGNLSRWLPMRERLILTEADEKLLPHLRKAIESHFTELPLPEIRKVDLSCKWEEDFGSEDLDTIVSFNVLEHVENDQEAIGRQISLLKRSHHPGPKRWVAIVPAHSWAYGSIDRSYGHYRRYSTGDFEKIRSKLDPAMRMTCRYMNIFGLPGWWVMGRILKTDRIGPDAVRTFEKICPWVRGVDDFLHSKLRLPLGQSLLCVFEVSPS